MSLTTTHESKSARQACEALRRGTTLCFQCFRSERERQRARQLSCETSATPLRSPVGVFAERAALSDREIAHRRVMLGSLERQRLDAIQR